MAYENENEFNVREMKQEDGESLNLKEVKRKKGKGKFSILKYILLAIVLAVILGGGFFVYQTGSAFDKMTGKSNSIIKSIAKMLPLGDNFFQILPVEKGEESPVDDIKSGKLDRLNVLLLGYRGVNDPNGGLLTDSMMVASISKSTGQIALISVPRDLYIKLPHSQNKGKINEAYALGTKNGGWEKALSYSKEAMEEVTGLKIHYVASVDFEAFKEIVDTLGGITVYLDKPFNEAVPFEEGYISLPAGKNTISGDKALLYSRARYSSSDFDRARRQQQVLMGIKEKALSMDLVSNPTKAISILNSLGNHVRTNAELWEIKDLALIFNDMGGSAKIKQKVFSTGEGGLLYETHLDNGEYVLLPQGGNYDKMHKACEEVLQSNS